MMKLLHNVGLGVCTCNILVESEFGVPVKRNRPTWTWQKLDSVLSFVVAASNANDGPSCTLSRTVSPTQTTTRSPISSTTRPPDTCRRGSYQIGQKGAIGQQSACRASECTGLTSVQECHDQCFANQSCYAYTWDQDANDCKLWKHFWPLHDTGGPARQIFCSLSCVFFLVKFQ